MNKLKKFGVLMLAAMMVMAGCGSKTAAPEFTSQPESGFQAESGSKPETGSLPESGTQEAVDLTQVTVRVGSLKGPTSIGLVSLMQEAKDGNSALSYADFTVVAAADELAALVVQGNLDIALVPANLAAVLYQKTEGGVTVLDINTLGVLYMVSGSDRITSIADLKGQTIYLTGKGTTPDYSLQYLLEANGIALSDVTLEYKSEATEVAAMLSENPEAVGVLPQPFVTAACTQNDKLSVVLDMTEEWEKVQGEEGGRMVTGVTIARKEFVEENPEVVAKFLEEHKASTEFTATDLEKTAAYVVELGIIAKEPIAIKAIPECNIVCLTGDEMKTSLESYLTVLFEKDAKAVGGKMPGEDFYYVP